MTFQSNFRDTFLFAISTFHRRASSPFTAGTGIKAIYENGQKESQHNLGYFKGILRFYWAPNGAAPLEMVLK